MAFIVMACPNAAQRTHLVRALEQAGHVVDETDDGWIALARIGQRRPDLVLAEVYMEGMDGVELLRRVRSIWPEARVVLLGGASGTLAEDTSDMIAALGAAAIIENSTDVDEVCRRVEEVLSA